MKKHFLKLVLALILSLPFNSAFADQSSHEQAAKNLLDAMNINKVMIEAVEKMVERQIQKKPQLSLFKDVIRTFSQKYMTGEALYKAMATMYMEEFTENELVDIANFYKSSAGQKAINKLPILNQKGAQWGQKQVAENMDELKGMINEEVKKLEELKKSSTQ